MTLYEHDGFRGRSTILTEDSNDLGRTAVGNDALSSLEVRCEPREETPGSTASGG